MWPDPRLLEDLDDKANAERLDRGRAWLSSDSPEERAAGLMLLCGGMAREEVLGPLLNALDDRDRRVQMAALLHLLWYDPPPGHGDRIVAHLGGELRAVERFVEIGCGPGSIGSLGLTERLFPYLDQVAVTGRKRKYRRRAAWYARKLREQPLGWPMTGGPSAEQSA